VQGDDGVVGCQFAGAFELREGTRLIAAAQRLESLLQMRIDQETAITADVSAEIELIRSGRGIRGSHRHRHRHTRGKQ
jgi:hypothetical protein